MKTGLVIAVEEFRWNYKGGIFVHKQGDEFNPIELGISKPTMVDLIEFGRVDYGEIKRDFSEILKSQKQTQKQTETDVSEREVDESTETDSEMQKGQDMAAVETKKPKKAIRKSCRKSKIK